MDIGRTVIHTNSSLGHQVAWAESLQAGFKVHGVDSKISFNRDDEADTHVVLGPNFAYQQWRYANTFYLDRAFWGDPDCCSLHWLIDGEKVFSSNDTPRKHPERQPLKGNDRAIVLCDYKMCGSEIAKAYGADVRPHPNDIRMNSSDPASVQSLQETLKQYDIAIGFRTTALVDAYIAGLHVVSDYFGDINLNHLAWHNWSHAEIASGEAWQHYANY